MQISLIHDILSLVVQTCIFIFTSIFPLFLKKIKLIVFHIGIDKTDKGVTFHTIY